MKSNIIFIELFITFWSFIFSNVNGAACAHTVSGSTIDLSSLSADTLTYTSGDWTYYYTPCRDGLACVDSAGVSQSAMADQYKAGNEFCTAYLGLWDDVSPTYSNGVFTFTWSNGQSSNTCSTGRKFIAKWSCGSSAWSVKSIAQTDSDCDYTMTIESSLACAGGSDDTSDLSVGTILLIAVISAIFLYCVIGYVICAKKNPDNGWGNVKANTPHLSLWCLVPKLTWAGCCVTKEFTMNKINGLRGKADGDSGYDTVADE